MSSFCFVIMGFGKKTDFESGRTLNLDATYHAIIKPACDFQNLNHFRADEVTHSGYIDKQMFELLLRADVVIADISTANPNAIYELGVRHALRPYSTIIMKENYGRLQFDLNHINTFHYEHLDDDIGYSEAQRAQKELSKLLHEALSNNKTDSPVYTFLPKLQTPTLQPESASSETSQRFDNSEDFQGSMLMRLMSDEQFEEVVARKQQTEQHLSNLVEKAQNEAKQSAHIRAKKYWQAAMRVKPDDSYIIQQLALSTYKSRHPSDHEALNEALSVIDELRPHRTNDPETLGIAAAIHKRRWKLSEDILDLSTASELYGRGFNLQKDYYNGENFAFCLDELGIAHDSSDYKLYYHVHAEKVRESVLKIISGIMAEPDFGERLDSHWVYGTQANCLFAFGRFDEARIVEDKFLNFDIPEWMKDTYREQRDRTIAVARRK